MVPVYHRVPPPPSARAYIRRPAEGRLVRPFTLTVLSVCSRDVLKSTLFVCDCRIAWIFREFLVMVFVVVSAWISVTVWNYFLAACSLGILSLLDYLCLSLPLVNRRRCVQSLLSL